MDGLAFEASACAQAAALVHIASSRANGAPADSWFERTALGDGPRNSRSCFTNWCRFDFELGRQYDGSGPHAGRAECAIGPTHIGCSNPATHAHAT